jgi:hypothetical protein
MSAGTIPAGLDEDDMRGVSWNNSRKSVGRSIGTPGFSCVRRFAVALGFVAALAGTGASAATVQQEVFDSPDRAVAALVAAVRADETREVLGILGPAGRKLIWSGDRVADREGREKFAAAYDEANKLVPEGTDRTMLEIGKDEWPFPIPLVKQDNHWRFDTKAGAQEILDRRIGRNELDAIEVCRAYVDAQRDYASQDRAGGGLLAYAQKFVSSRGKHDGLYWPTKAGEAESPLGPLMASARAEGYGVKGAKGKREPYHGYYYRILTHQGPHAPRGAYDYVVNGKMIGGFALVAFPAKYGASGIMSFLVNQDGAVFQKDLGKDSAALARRMSAFDPDESWQKL